MAVPVIIFVVCFGAGVFAASRWLPDLPPGPVGGLSFFAVCGLLGAAVGIFGLRIYGIVEVLEKEGSGNFAHIELANGLEQLLWQCALLIGVAAGVYLLADNRPALSRPPGEPS
jgi:hypothetical protein